MSLLQNDFEESEHPRAEDGKFVRKGGTYGGGKSGGGGGTSRIGRVKGEPLLADDASDSADFGARKPHTPAKAEKKRSGLQKAAFIAGTGLAAGAAGALAASALGSAATITSASAVAPAALPAGSGALALVSGASPALPTSSGALALVSGASQALPAAAVVPALAGSGLAALSVGKGVPALPSATGGAATEAASAVAGSEALDVSPGRSTAVSSYLSDEIPTTPSKRISEYLKECRGNQTAAIRRFYQNEFEGKIVSDAAGNIIHYERDGRYKMAYKANEQPLKLPLVEKSPDIIRTGYNMGTSIPYKPHRKFNEFTYYMKKILLQGEGPDGVDLLVEAIVDVGHGLEREVYSLMDESVPGYATKKREIQRYAKKKKGNSIAPGVDLTCRQPELPFNEYIVTPHKTFVNVRAKTVINAETGERLSEYEDFFDEPFLMEQSLGETGETQKHVLVGQALHGMQPEHSEGIDTAPVWRETTKKGNSIAPGVVLTCRQPELPFDENTIALHSGFVNMSDKTLSAKSQSGSGTGRHESGGGEAFTPLSFTTFANARIKNWRIDGDGMLRVTACVLKEGVYPYGAHEVHGEAAAAFAGIDPVMEYIPVSEFTDDALASLEGKPVVVGAHEWRDAENTLVDGFTVGTIAGRPRVDDSGGLLCDMLIFDSETIKQITDRKLVEVSAGYDGTILPGEGRFNGHKYHGTQQHLRFNHVLLLPAGGGRCGRDVRIINRGCVQQNEEPLSSANQPYAQSAQGGALGTLHAGVPTKGDTMSQARSVSLSTSSGVYNFTNEVDANTAAAMQQRQQEVVNGEKAGWLEEKEQMAARIAALEMEVQSCKEELAKRDEKLLQANLAEQEKDERAIIEAANADIDEEEQVDFDEFAKELNNCKTLAERRKATVKKMNAMRGIADKSKGHSSHDETWYTAIFVNEADTLKKGRNRRQAAACDHNCRNTNSRSVRRSEEPGVSQQMSKREHILRCMSSNARVRINP